MAGLSFACACGAVEGQLDAIALRNGLRIVCYCKSCRAAEVHAGHPDPAQDPADLFQVPPAHVDISRGKEHLAPFKLSPGGVLRWQATCCGTLVGNTPENARLSVFALRTALAGQSGLFGPVRARAFVPRPGGKTRTEGISALLTRTAWNMMASRIGGNWRSSPFFANAAPIRAPRLFSKDERAALFERLDQSQN